MAVLRKTGRDGRSLLNADVELQIICLILWENGEGKPAFIFYPLVGLFYFFGGDWN